MGGLFFGGGFIAWGYSLDIYTVDIAILYTVHWKKEQYHALSQQKLFSLYWIVKKKPHGSRSLDHCFYTGDFLINIKQGHIHI